MHRDGSSCPLWTMFPCDVRLKEVEEVPEWIGAEREMTGSEQIQGDRDGVSAAVLSGLPAKRGKMVNIAGPYVTPATRKKCPTVSALSRLGRKQLPIFVFVCCPI